MTASDAGKRGQVEDLSYDDAVRELEQIVSDLDGGAINVDTLSEQFQRAIDIVEELDRRITKTRQKVDALAPRLDVVAGRLPDRADGEDEESF